MRQLPRDRAWLSRDLVQLAAGRRAEPRAMGRAHRHRIGLTPHAGPGEPEPRERRLALPAAWPQWWSLIVTMDNTTSETYLAFFVEEEGTMTSFRASREVIEVQGLLCSLYADHASHYCFTPEARGKVDKDKPSQIGSAWYQVDPGLLARGAEPLRVYVRNAAETPATGTQACRHHRHGRGKPATPARVGAESFRSRRQLCASFLFKFL